MTYGLTIVVGFCNLPVCPDYGDKYLVTWTFHCINLCSAFYISHVEISSDESVSSHAGTRPHGGDCVDCVKTSRLPVIIMRSSSLLNITRAYVYVVSCQAGVVVQDGMGQTC